MYKVISIVGGSFAMAMSFKVQAKEMVECHECHMRRLPKARELPLYATDCCKVELCEKSMPLIDEVSAVRKQIFQYASYVKVAQDYGVHVYETGVAHTKGAIEQLKDEENKLQRALFISSGGLLGLLFARKGGFFKKVLYTSLGTGIVFSAFYPDVSKEVLQTSWSASKQQLSKAIKLGGFDEEKITEDLKSKWEYINKSVKLEPVVLKVKDLIKGEKQPVEVGATSAAK